MRNALPNKGKRDVVAAEIVEFEVPNEVVDSYAPEDLVSTFASLCEKSGH